MTVRPASAADAPAIAGIEARAAHAPWTEAQVRESLDAPTTLAWVAGDPPVGHLLASAVADEGEVLTLAVDPAARRRGLASALLRACQQAWRDHGVVNGWLEVRVDNDAARALYRSQGWVDAGVRPRYYADGADAAVMKWQA